MISISLFQLFFDFVVFCMLNSSSGVLNVHRRLGCCVQPFFFSGCYLVFKVTSETEISKRRDGETKKNPSRCTFCREKISQMSQFLRGASDAPQIREKVAKLVYGKRKVFDQGANISPNAPNPAALLAHAPINEVDQLVRRLHGSAAFENPRVLMDVVKRLMPFKRYDKALRIARSMERIAEEEERGWREKQRGEMAAPQLPPSNASPAPAPALTPSSSTADADFWTMAASSPVVGSSSAIESAPGAVESLSVTAAPAGTQVDALESQPFESGAPNATGLPSSAVTDTTAQRSMLRLKDYHYVALMKLALTVPADGNGVHQRNIGGWKEALRLFNIAGRRGIPLTRDLAGMTLAACRHGSQWRRACDVFTTVVRDQVPFDARGLHSLQMVLRETGHWAESIAAFSVAVGQAGAVPNEASYMELLRTMDPRCRGSSSSRGRPADVSWQAALQVATTLRGSPRLSLGLGFDNTLLGVLASAHRWQETLQLFSAMVQRGAAAGGGGARGALGYNAVSLETVASVAQFRSQNPHVDHRLLIALLRRCRADEIAPPTRLYRRLFACLGHQNRAKEVLALFERLTDEAVLDPANSNLSLHDLYLGLLDALLTFDDPEAAAVIAEHVRDAVEPAWVTATAGLSQWGEQGDQWLISGGTRVAVLDYTTTFHLDRHLPLLIDQVAAAGEAPYDYAVVPGADVRNLIADAQHCTNTNLQQRLQTVQWLLWASAVECADAHPTFNVQTHSRADNDGPGEDPPPPHPLGDTMMQLPIKIRTTPLTVSLRANAVLKDVAAAHKADIQAILHGRSAPVVAGQLESGGTADAAMQQSEASEGAADGLWTPRSNAVVKQRAKEAADRRVETQRAAREAAARHFSPAVVSSLHCIGVALLLRRLNPDAQVEVVTRRAATVRVAQLLGVPVRSFDPHQEAPTEDGEADHSLTA
jgi:hypothetical protein